MNTKGLGSYVPSKICFPTGVGARKTGEWTVEADQAHMLSLNFNSYCLYWGKKWWAVWIHPTLYGVLTLIGESHLLGNTP